MQMTQVLKKTMAAVLAVCGAVAFGSEFSNKSGSGTRDFWAPTTWSGGTLPANGSFVQLASYAKELELTFSKDVDIAIDDLEIKCGNAQAASGNGNKLIFNGDGRIFCRPDYDGNNAAVPLRFEVYRNDLGADQKFLQFTYDKKSGSATRGIYKWKDPVFTLEGFSDYSGLLTFVKGDYNFFDPNGEEVNTEATFGDNLKINATTVFGPETTFRVWKVYLSRTDAADGQSNALIADGSTWDIDTEIQVRKGGYLAITNGATAALGKIAISGGQTLIAGEKTKVTTAEGGSQSIGSLTVADGATLDMSGQTFTTSSGDFVVTNGAKVTLNEHILKEGATLHLAGGAYTDSSQASIGNGTGSGTTAKIWVTGGTHRFNGGDTFIGRGYNAEVLVEGGSLYVNRFRTGQGTAPTKQVLIRQTGGLITTSVSPDRAQSGILLCFVGVYPCTVRLEGGETQCSRLRYRYNPEDASYSSAAAAEAKFVGDGGTLVPNYASSSASPFMGYLGSATLGAKGLTLDNRNKLETYVKQDFGNVEGESGELRVTGGSTIQYEGAFSASKLTLNGATFKLATAATTCGTALTVNRGAVFSMAGDSAAIELDELTVDGGTLTLDPGDVITVKGAASVSGMVLDWTSVPTDPTGFLVVEGEMDEATEMAIRNALSTTLVEAGKHIGFTVTREDGKVTFSVQLKDNDPVPESANVSWTGASGSAWSTADNWDPSVPAAENRAVFGDVAQKSVTVGEAASVGALRFTADGYQVGGEGPLTITGEQGAAEIAVDAGSQKITTPVKALSVTAVPVAAGSSLELAGSVTGGGLAKSGTGALTLSGANMFYGGFSSAAGVVTVRDDEALSCGTTAKAQLNGGTLTFEADGEEPLKLVNAPLVAAATAEATTVVFDVTHDVELDDFSMTGGAFFKRGAGTMTVNVTPEKPVTWTGTMLTPNQDISNQGANGPWVFPEDGSAPVGGVNKGGFNVSEGKVVLRGVGEGAKLTVNETLTVGGPARVCAVQPELVVSNLEVTVSGEGGFWSGSCVGSPVCYNAVRHPVLRLMEGAVFRNSAYVQPGYGSTSAGTFSYVVTGGSTFESTSSYLVREPAGGGTLEFVFTNSECFVAAPSTVSGRIRGDFHNSFFGSNDNYGSVELKFTEKNRPAGEMFFHDGSVFCCSKLTETDETIVTQPLTFAFDNAEWRPYRKNNSDWTLPKPKSSKIVYEMRGAGAVFAPTADVTYLIVAQLTGEGGVINRGEGTLRFQSDAYHFTGPCRAEKGTVDLSLAGTLRNAKFGGGAGTISGATLDGATLALTADDDWNVAETPTFANCSISGSLRIDLGRDEAHSLPTTLPQSLKVGMWTGSGALPTKVKIFGTGGRKLAGSVTVNDQGELFVEPYVSGAVLIVR